MQSILSELDPHHVCSRFEGTSLNSYLFSSNITNLLHCLVLLILENGGQKACIL